MIVFLFFSFIFGAALGSFLNVVAWRTVRGKSFVEGRSHCPNCDKTLFWYELLPIAGYFLVGGRCRTCLAYISVRYLVVELIMGFYTATLVYFIFLGTAVASPFPILLGFLGDFEPSVLIFLYLVLGGVVLTLSLIDFETKLIYVVPLRVLALLGVALGFIEVWFEKQQGSFGNAALYQLAAALAIFAFFMLVTVVSRGRGMGAGDAEFAGTLALFLPLALSITMVLFAFWSGAIVGVCLMLMKGYKRNAQIPFGPFIAVGFFSALFWGQSLLSHLFIVV